MNWQWLIDEGLIEGDVNLYNTGSLGVSDFRHAIETAYAAADDAQRKRFIDDLWSTGYFEGDKEHWYTDRSGDPAEMTNLLAAGGQMGTPEIGGGSELLLAGNAQLWQNTETGQWWVVYVAPAVNFDDGTASPELYYGWAVESPEDLEAVVGPGVEPVASFAGDNGDFTSIGLVSLGGVSELNMWDLEGDPFDTWVEDMTVLAETRPWILDPDWIALAVQAALERADGQVSVDEIRTTNWWKNHNEQERYWMETVHGDPAAAEQLMADNRESMRYKIAQAGVNNATEDLINFFADKVTTGGWSLMHQEAQLNALSDPYSVDVLDPELVEFLAGTDLQFDATAQGEDEVRNLLRTWLGPVWGDWTESEIAAKAGEIRNDPDASQAFVESLKDQRLSLFPNHTDRSLSYEAIARPWMAYAQSIWGSPVDEMDDVFQQALAMNDQTEASKLLRRTGFDRGYDSVVSRVTGGLEGAMASNVRGAV